MHPRTMSCGAFVVLLLALAAGSAKAEKFTVKAQIFCPAWTESVPGRSFAVVDDKFTPANKAFVPCRAVRVQVIDADDDWDDFCGEAHADSNGRVSIPSDCWDPAGGHPNVYLRIYASTYTVRVGVHGWGWWDYLGAGAETLMSILVQPNVVVDYLMSNDRFYWTYDESHTRVADHDGQVIDFGGVKIGGGNNDPEFASRRAGMALFAGRISMEGVRESGHRPKREVITINHPTFGAPTTIWDTIIVQDTHNLTDLAPGKFRFAARAIPHEIGHATYNRYHSGFDHYLVDALEYLHNHGSCSNFGKKFAWYEGFAEWVRDFIFSAARDGDAPGGLVSSNNYDKAHGCFWEKVATLSNPSTTTPDAGAKNVAGGFRGFHREGNVTALLDQFYLGPYRAANLEGRNRSSGFRWATQIDESVLIGGVVLPDGSTGSAVAPALGEPFHFVSSAPADTHTLQQFYDGHIAPFCQQIVPPGFTRYCGTTTFATEANFLGDL